MASKRESRRFHYLSEYGCLFDTEAGPIEPGQVVFSWKHGRENSDGTMTFALLTHSRVNKRLWRLSKSVTVAEAAAHLQVVGMCAEVVMGAAEAGGVLVVRLLGSVGVDESDLKIEVGENMYFVMSRNAETEKLELKLWLGARRPDEAPDLAWFRFGRCRDAGRVQLLTFDKKTLTTNPKNHVEAEAAVLKRLGATDSYIKRLFK